MASQPIEAIGPIPPSRRGHLFQPFSNLLRLALVVAASVISFTVVAFFSLFLVLVQALNQEKFF